MASRKLFKDESLTSLAETGNVAQFVSFGPEAPGKVRHSRINGRKPDEVDVSPGEVVAALLDASPDGTVNVRTFRPDSPDGNPFEYGMSDPDEVHRAVTRFLDEGYHVIVNETVDVEDGGVSGVLQHGVIEFAPGTTPRGVEDKAVASLPAELGLRLLETVYGVPIPLPKDGDSRVEFSLHPRRRGYRHDHVILWQSEEIPQTAMEPRLAWPNDFSRFVGDKAYGLLMAHLLGAPVPRTTVVGRYVAPFRFGRETGEAEVWTRPCPSVQLPGYFTTTRGWTDPFALVESEDKDRQIASILAQQSVPAAYAGSSRTDADGRFEAEGVAGTGEHYMDGTLPPADLPPGLRDQLQALFDRLHETLGGVSFEWVFDGNEVWVVQLHRRQSTGGGRIIVAGEAENWVTVRADLPLEEFRALTSGLDPSRDGVLVSGPMGATSHKAHILESAGLPARFAD